MPGSLLKHGAIARGTIIPVDLLELKLECIFLILNGQMTLYNLSGLVDEANHLLVLGVDVCNESLDTLALGNAHEMTQQECPYSSTLIIILYK